MGPVATSTPTSLSYLFQIVAFLDNEIKFPLKIGDDFCDFIFWLYYFFGFFLYFMTFISLLTFRRRLALIRIKP